MPPSNSIQPSSLRWFYMYLFLLEQIKKTINNDSLISHISKEDLLRVTESKSCKREALFILEKLRSGKSILKNSITLIELIKKEATKKHSEIGVLKKKDRFKGVIDDDFTTGLISDEEEVRNKLEEGLKRINDINAEWFLFAKQSINLVSGIYDEYNVINSGFTKDMPGFISFNTNCSADIIGEQIAHETTHLNFDNIMFAHDETRNFVKSIPPLYSNFAKKPRSAELVIHGLFSYTAVYLYWDHLSTIDISLSKQANRRKQKVISYVQEAISHLDNVLTDTDWKKLYRLFTKICPLNPDDLWKRQPKRQVDHKQILRLAKPFLSNIELAELLLAIEGNKVSRISKRVHHIGNLINVLRKLPIFYCFSNYLFESNAEENLSEFKNVITSTENLDSNLHHDPEIHIYLSKNKNLLKKAYVLDQKDKCGSLFGTPACCQRHFLQNWNYAVEHYNGDLVRVHYPKNNFIIERGQLYSPIGMYFGYGVCWHFPCRIDCKHTRKLVDVRINLLNKHPSLIRDLIKIKDYKIVFELNKGYRLLKTKSKTVK